MGLLRFAKLKNRNLLVLISLFTLCDTIFSFLFLLFLYSFLYPSRFESGQCLVKPWSCHELAFALPPPWLVRRLLSFFSLSFHWTYLWSLDISLLSYFFQRFLDYKSLNHLNIFFSVKEFGIEKSKQKLSSSIF